MKQVHSRIAIILNLFFFFFNTYIFFFIIHFLSFFYLQSFVHMKSMVAGWRYVFSDSVVGSQIRLTAFKYNNPWGFVNCSNF